MIYKINGNEESLKVFVILVFNNVFGLSFMLIFEWLDGGYFGFYFVKCLNWKGVLYFVFDFFCGKFKENVVVCLELV